MKLQVFVLTAGNDIVFETLESIKAIKVPHETCVWYHALDDRFKVDLDFYNRLTTYTDDVIMATKNQGCPPAHGYALVYKKYDQLLMLDDDMIVLDGAVEKMFTLHKFFRRIGFIGEGVESHKMSALYEIDNIRNLPDWGGIWNHEAVNSVGSFAAMFPKYGFDFIEMQMRMIANEWRVINYKGLLNHGGKTQKQHVTRDKMNDLPDIHGESFSKYRVCEALNFKTYNWWADKI